jgi:peptidoglycan/LPS O-acetylase OafA/YrhL
MATSSAFLKRAFGAQQQQVRTHTGRIHFEALDGLRGVAALVVLIYHVSGIPLDFDRSKVMFHHAPLSVDFFFALSGYVVGYAYDGSWSRMTTLEFFRIRLRRLHPLVMLGSLLGLLSYLLDPFAGDAQSASTVLLAIAFLAGMLLLPAPPLPNRWADTHPLNGPSWSLLQEYIGNIAYALILRRLSTRTLGVLAVAAAVVLLGRAAILGSLDAGWSWLNLDMAPVRLCYPFLAGLLLYRTRERLPGLRIGFVPLTAALLVVFLMPVFPSTGRVQWNGVYEAGAVILLFPLIVMTGAHSDMSNALRGVCNLFGRLSYPLYMIHFPFCYAYASFVLRTNPSRMTTLAIELLIIPCLLLFAWLACRFWDEPLRAYFQRFSNEPRNTQAPAVLNDLAPSASNFDLRV